MRINQYALKPSFTMTLLSDGAALDLTGADVTMVGVQGVAEVFRDEAPTVSATAGLVTHAWVAGETDAVGDIFVNVFVQYADSKPITFPVLGSEVVRVGPAPEPSFA